MLKETKNEFLVRLLSQDSKNLLADDEPFRHKLLKARNKDANLAQVFIPMLESELIDSSRTQFYLSHLEQLFRAEAYLTHLNKRAATTDNQQATDNRTDLSQFNLVDLDTLRRRQGILDKIKEQQHQKQTKKSVENNQYKSVVKEVEVDVSNPFTGLLQRLFISGRKLKPIVKQRQPVSLESIKECKIFVHIIKGENVPIRH